MALKVIGAGYGRTGTLSTQAALNRLGFPCYHMLEVLENPANQSHLDFWLGVARDEPGAQHDWERAFAGYTATVDNPGCCVWRELMAAYPDAKVILTLHPRGPVAWFESTLATIYFTERMWQFKVLEKTTPFGRKFGEMSRRLIWQRSHRGTMPDRAQAVARYVQHVEEVKAAVPPERLLIFSADEGWWPLCDFLGVPVPEEPFPNLNDRTAINAKIRDITKGAYVIVGGALAALVGLGWSVYGLLS